MHRILEQVCAIAAPERPGTVPDHLPALGPVVGSAHFLGWFGSSWDENRESRPHLNQKQRTAKPPG